MVGKYLWGNLQSHRIMDEFLQEKIRQHLEVAPYITLYLFEHRSPRVEVVELSQKVDLQYKIISQIEKTCKKLQPRADSLTDKANLLGKK